MLIPRIAIVVTLCALSTSCALYYRAGIGLYYRKAAVPATQVRLNIPYAGPSSTSKQRLNLFLPAVPDGRPFAVFVHGGNWDAGDRDLTVGGADVYNNIGRYLAARGVGTAVISYRLLPEVTWRQQIADVSAAVLWVNVHAKDYGGSGNCVFVMGHSAGAQLAARVALDPDAGGALLPSICGVIGVSGAAYDLTDEPTYAINDDLDWYAERFGGTRGWQDAASPIRFLGSGTRRRVPPFLLLYAGGEGRAVQRQSQLLHAALLRAGASSSLVVVPGESHSRIVLTLSRDGKTAGPAILNFVRSHSALPPSVPPVTASRSYRD